MLSYNGQSIPVLSIQPDWSSSIKLSERYEPIVREALDHSEDRLATKPRATYRIKFSSLTLSARETGYVRKILELSESMPLAVPLWTDALSLTKPAAAGNPFVECDPTAGTLFDVLPFVVVWHDFATFDAAKRAGVGPAQVWFDQALVNSYAVGDRVAPLAIGNVRKDIASNLTDENAVLNVEFVEGFFPDPIQSCQAISGVNQYAQVCFAEQCAGGPML